MNIFATFVILSAAAVLCAAQIPHAMSGFADAQKFDARTDVCSFPDDDTLAIDTVKASDWNVVLRTKAGLLKPDTEYKLSFRYEIEEGAPEDARFLLLVRPAGKITPEDDCMQADVSTSGVQKRARISFKTGSRNDYSLQICVGGKFVGKILKLRLREGSYDKFIPFYADATKSRTKIKKLPTGAREFNIEQPNPKRESVVNAADFGLKENCASARECLNAAIAHCKKTGASKLEVNKGVYYISQDDPVLFDGLADFTFDGGGSTFVFFKKRGCHFEVRNCLRTRLQNFKVDWDWKIDPLAALVKILAVDAKEKFVDVKFLHYDAFPNKTPRLVLMTPYDEKAQSVGIDGKREFNFNNNGGTNNPPIKWLSKNTLRIWHVAPEYFSAGDVFRLVFYSYDMGCFRFFDNRHFTVENVDIYSTPGCGINVGGSQQYWAFKNLNMVFPPDNDPRRCITSTADHCHIINSRGFFKMENCDFGWGCDDCINMHDCSVFARKAAPRTLSGKKAGRFLSVGDEVEFRNADYSPANFSAKVAAISLFDPDNDIWTVDFDRDIPDTKSDGFVLFNKRYDTRNIIVRNCRFHNNRARGLLILASDVSIENNVFLRNEQGGIKIETGYTHRLWCEGFGAHNIKISGNTFDTVNPAGATNRRFERDFFIGSYQKRDPTDDHTNYPILSDILIENNKFKDTFGLCAYIASAGNVIIRNNVFEAETPRKNAREYRGGFYIRNASNIMILDNIYKASPLFQKLGVRYDGTNAENIIAQGNTIVK